MIRKFLKKISKLFFILLLTPIVLFIRIIRPIYRIQFIITPCEALGHQVGNLDIHLVKNLVNKPKRTAYIYFCPSIFSRPVANQHLRLMWSRTLPTFICSPILTKIILVFVGVSWNIPFCHALVGDIWIKEHGASDKDKTGKLIHTPSFLKFTTRELALGEAFFKKINIASMKYILLNSRINTGNNSQTFRNSKISSFFKAAKYLSTQGYHVLKMGVVSKDEIDASINYIIDYAKKYRTEFLDIFLSSRTAFYLGDSCGLFNLSICFRKPIAITNQAPIFFPPFCYEKALIIPKKYWLRHEKRYMTLSEIIKSGTAYCTDASRYEALGIELHDNTPEEIYEFAIEMHQRCNGLYYESSEDQDIQNTFTQRLMNESLLIEVNGAIRGKIATSFLKRNLFLLE